MGEGRDHLILPTTPHVGCNGLLGLPPSLWRDQAGAATLPSGARSKNLETRCNLTASS